MCRLNHSLRKMPPKVPKKKPSKLNLENENDKWIKKRSELVPYPFPGVTDHCLFAGTTKSGKSHVIKSWLAGPYNKVFDDIFFINPTADKENYTTLFEIPEDNVMTDMDSDTLDYLFDDLKKRFFHRKADYCPLLIFDDCVDMLNTIPEFPKFMSTCRHYGITIWIAVQYLRNVRPPIRNQFIDFVIFPAISPENIKVVGEATIGTRNLTSFMGIVREINIERDTRYGYFYWSKSRPYQRFYGFETEIFEIEGVEDSRPDPSLNTNETEE